MKLLVDESMATSVAAELRAAGFDALHAADFGLLGAVDEVVMERARVEGRAVIAADTDFGALLALGRHHAPSVVLLRRGPHRPDAQARLLAEALTLVQSDIESGSIVVVVPGAVRVRALPIGPTDV